MANYIKATNFTAKDALPTGNPGKIIKGTEIDVEYTAIATAIGSKADTNSPTFTGTTLSQNWSSNLKLTIKPKSNPTLLIPEIELTSSYAGSEN